MTFTDIIAGGKSSLVRDRYTSYIGRVDGKPVCTISLYWDTYSNRLRASVTYCWTNGELATEFSVESVYGGGKSTFENRFGRYGITFELDAKRSELLGDDIPNDDDEFREWDRRKNDHDSEISRSLNPLPNLLPSGYPFE